MRDQLCQIAILYQNKSGDVIMYTVTLGKELRGAAALIKSSNK